MAKTKTKKLLNARITHLEMTSRPTKSFPLPSRPSVALLKTQNMKADFYRFLYEKVGKPHHWLNRREMITQELETIIQADQTHISVLYAEGCPAGFFEFDTSPLPETIKLVYFGLSPEYQGLGLGKWFLNCAIQAAWEEMPQRVCVDTNTLDHPSALSLYQKLGFSPFRISEEEVKAWD